MFIMYTKCPVVSCVHTGQDVDLSFNLPSLKQREMFSVICPFPVPVAAESSGGVNSVPSSVAASPSQPKQCELQEAATHATTGDAVACYLLCLAVHLRSPTAPTSAVNKAASVKHNSHR